MLKKSKNVRYFLTIKDILTNLFINFAYKSVNTSNFQFIFCYLKSKK